MELVWDEIYENQRWMLRKNWQPCPQIRIDPTQWTNSKFQKLPSIYDHRLPPSENENLRWVWVDEWQEGNWKYAISFGATFGTFTFKDKRSKKHFVRQRKWRRPRIRKIEIGTTEIREEVIENQRIMIKAWKSPYFPGDPPHYSDKNGKLLTIKQVESRLPPSWIWIQSEWNVEKGQHTDKNGWEYSADFHLGQWTDKFTPVLKSVRRKKYIRTRKLSGLIKETKKLDIIPYGRSKTWSRSKSASATTYNDANSNIKQIVIDDDTIDIDDGWGDDDDFVAGAKFSKFTGSKSGLPNPPFEIGVCWKYDKIFLETKKISDKNNVTLAIWKPKLGLLDDYIRVNMEEKNMDIDDDDNDRYMLGYLGLNHSTDPNDNIPMLIVKSGSDSNALRAPKNFELIHQEKIKRNSAKNKKVDVYRYWLKLIPEDDYIAMGSIVIDKYVEPIEDNVFECLKQYFWSHQQKNYMKIYSLDKLRCIHKKYVHEFGQPLVEKLLTSKKYNFILHRAQSLVVSGIYKLVELPCIIREQMKNDDDNNVKMEHHSACIDKDIMDLCVKRLQHEIRIVGEEPLIISYATHFKLKWSSKGLTSTSATKAAIWEPILGPDEFMVGHVAFGDWNHPSSHMNNCKLLIIKSGGSDPDAFKEPLGFECIWSVYKPGQKHQLGKSKGIGSGYLISAVVRPTGLVDDEPPPSASLWRAIAPQGYTALGDIIMPIDGEVGSVNKDGTKQKLAITQLLRSHDVPKYVCIRNKYLTNFRELEVDNEIKDDKYDVWGDNSKISKINTILENKVRSQIWSSERVKGLELNACVYEQEPVTRDILSPMFCKSGLETPNTNELYPTLNIDNIIEAPPYWKVVKAGILRKKGEGFYAKSHKRYFVLTNEKLIYYYDEINEKGRIKLEKMQNCDIVKGSNKEFYIECPDRKWELEIIDDISSGGNVKEWVNSIKYVFNNRSGGDEIEEEDKDDKSLKSNALLIEEKESEQIKIVKLLTKMMKRYEKLLLHNIENENETSESVESAVKWYEDLENTRSAIDILLAKWPRGTICPPGVVPARAKLEELMKKSEQVILDDIKALANENMSNFTILRLHKACCLMSDLDSGQKLICEYITEKLLKNAQNVFSAGNEHSALKYIDRRFNEYRRQMKDYDNRYGSFIPKWWDLPIKISSRFCNLMGETLDDQLTRFPENHDAISLAKQKCVKFEKELIEQAMRRICCIEIDVRSWTKWDGGDPVSYIKIDNNNVMLTGAGICVIAIDLFTKKILKKKLFKIHKYSAYKKHEKHCGILKQWLLYLNDIDEQTLIIMASNEWSGQCEFKKSLGIKNGLLPKELLDLNININDMIDENNLFENKGSFIYIGRKGRKDSYFTFLKKKKGFGPVMSRQIISPFIPKNRLEKLCDTEQIPFYEGIISQVLERHLDIFVGEEAKNVQKVLSNIFNDETLLKLEEKKWLSTINRKNEKSNAQFESIVNIENTMKISIDACIKISNGKPLLELLRKYSKMLQEYASIMLKLMNDAGGNKLTNKLNLNEDNKKVLSKLIDDNGGDDEKDESIKKRGFSIFSNMNNNNEWNTEEIQYFIIYCCMIYNTCNKSRELVNELILIGKNDLQLKYRNGCKKDLIETRQLFLSIEEQCLQLIRASVMDKFESIFEFEKHQNWTLEKYKTELITTFDLYLTNCSKLLNTPALQHFYKIFIGNFALKLFDKILNSHTLASDIDSGGSILIDFPPIVQTVIFKQIPQRSINKMKIFIDRCLNPVKKLIQLAYANAGDKYYKLETIKNENNNQNNPKNIFSNINKFFGGGNKNKNKNNKLKDDDNETKDNEIDITKQMMTRQKSIIVKTVFAQKAIAFYTDKDIKLEILHNIPSYKELFDEDDDDENIKVINQTLNNLNNVDIIDTKNDNNNNSDSPLPNIDNNNNNNNIPIDDDDYFGINKQETPKKKSASGFVVKKTHKKKKKRLPPSMTAPRIPMRDTPLLKNITLSEPPKGDNKATVGFGIGLSAISLIANKKIKLNTKWIVILKIMKLRGFDVADQQTIKILCEDAQENIEAQK